MTRINKFLAECGVCSRREADRLIESGRVSVNGKTAVSGMQVSDTDDVEVLYNPAVRESVYVVLAYNMHVGVTCTEKDRHAEMTIIEALQYPVRLTYAGRLDRESDGLMIMTNDGELIQRMMKGANRHEKEYAVRVDKELTDSALEGMSRGVYLKELDKTTRPCKLKKTGKYTFRIILTQGLNRQIRRMCECFGYRVSSLTRVRIMNIELRGLKAGEYRELHGEELSALYEACGMNEPGKGKFINGGGQ